jgi:hypothetical protein
VLENCTPGSVRGTAGNRRSYRAAILRSTEVCCKEESSDLNLDKNSRQEVKYRASADEGIAVEKNYLVAGAGTIASRILKWVPQNNTTLFSA